MPLTGKLRVLLPDRSVKGPLLPLSQVKLSLPVVGVNAQAARVEGDAPMHSEREMAQAE